MKKILMIAAIGATVLASCGKSEKQVALEKQQALAAYRDSIKLDSFRRAEVEAEKRRVEERHQAELAAARRSATRSYSSGGGTVTTSSAGVTSTQAQKKGWSDAAKGTAIGAGVGAIGGALIDKKKGRGAIIGGLAGAGAGYAIGRAEDRKSGRVQPKQ
ncbi:MAG: YMGG-like glycine zipper-containing protein [Pedobacter sp.]|uniref:YMGG-like glycine zipper-containing protein n=1 Tax=Pedobacter sp. TaxID=1411316 RepID=UPI002806DA13|nr:YMGG-like glycine zipper-containing protein [Pedobacter sp.]MDQ8004112.1 YMGG-like glycine zipper-containing protein [Pedobacter sp.]